MDDETGVKDNRKENLAIKKVVKEVYSSLEERGYNPITQLVGYILSGDLGYISNYKKARNKIAKIERSELVTELLNSYIK